MGIISHSANYVLFKTLKCHALKIDMKYNNKVIKQFFTINEKLVKI